MTEARRIINSWDQIMASGGTGVMIVPSTITTSRANYTPATAWRIIRYVKGRQMITDQNAPWYHHGCKAFSFSLHGSKKNAVLAAQAWVKEQGWQDGPWVRNRQGDYVAADVNKQFPIPKVLK